MFTRLREGYIGMSGLSRTVGEISPIEHVWQVVHHGPPTTTFDSFWTRIQTA